MKFQVFLIIQITVTLFLTSFVQISILYAHHGKTKLLLDVAAAPVKFDNFSSMNLDNQLIQLSDYQGKVIFLNFWATWCVPCKKEMPDMKHLDEKIQNQQFVIVTVNMQESPEKIKKFFKDLNLSFITVLDPEGDIFEKYNANRLPITYIINKKGLVVARALGPRNWASQESIDYFTHLLNE